MAARPIFGLISLLFVAGAILLHFLVLLGGAVSGAPENDIFFFEADTSGIPGAAAVSRWTFWNAYGYDNSGNVINGAVHPAYPFDPPRNFANSDGSFQMTNIPAGFMDTHYYYYMTRFMFAFNLIALFFMVVALFTGLIALCSRIGSYLSSVTTFVALIFEILTAVLMTVAYVKGRDLFNGNNMAASLGQKAFGFLWAAVALLILSTVLFCLGGAFSGESSGGRFGRKRSTRSRGSFIDSDSQRPVVTEV